MKKLLTLGPQEIQSGIYQGVNKAAVPLWASGRNISFKELGMRKDGGAVSQTGPATGLVRDIAQAYVSATVARRAYLGTDTRIMLAEQIAGVWTLTSLYTWPTAGVYADLETFGTWVVGTNGIDPVVVWKNTGSAAALAGVTFTKARILKRKLVFMFAMNTSNGDTVVEWSSDSNIEDWTPTAANKAGSYNIRDLDSEIMAAEDLGDKIAVYSRSRMNIGSFIGSPNIWGFKAGPKGIGAVSRRSVVSVDAYNYGLNQFGIWKTDGVSMVYIDDPSNIRKLRDLVDWSRANFIWGFHDESLRRVTWFFQDINGTWVSISYHYTLEVFTWGDLQLTAGGPKEVFDYPLVTDTARMLGTWQEDSNRNFAVDVPFSLKTKPLDFGTRDVQKLLQCVRIDGVYDASTKIKVQALQDPEDAAPVTIIDQAMTNFNYFEYEAPYFTTEFYGAKPCNITGIEYFGLPGGDNVG